jgi:pentatricopeptide repeat protein
MKAKNAGDWSRVVELERTSVRGMCSNQFRWYELISALLQAHRDKEALAVFEEMRARGFDLNPSLPDLTQPDVREFMDSAAFRASPVGIEIARLKRLSDARRARFREALANLPPAQRPPDHYVARDVCPFECCHYGEWTASEDTNLFDAPGSSRVVAKVAKGTRVAALTGEVHLTPEPVVVLGGELPKDTIAFILDYQGEGYSHVYSRGRILSLFSGVADYCLRVSDACWGERLAPEVHGPEPVWWVKVRLANGTIGWTDKPDHFDGKDGCG